MGVRSCWCLADPSAGVYPALFTPGCTDVSKAQIDVQSFAVLEPTADRLRSYFGDGNGRSLAEMLVEKADLLKLAAPQMTVLVWQQI